MENNKNIQEPQDLLNFDWDTEETFGEFFVEEESETKTETKNEENKEVEFLDEKDKDKDENKKSIDDDNGKENNNEEENENKELDFFTETEKENETDKKDNYLLNITEKLKEKGIFSKDVSLEEIEDEDDLVALYEQEIEKRLEDRMQSVVDNVGEEGKLFLQYVKDGGKPDEFFKVLKDTVEIPTIIEDSEYSYTKVVEYYLRNVKDITDDEDIKDTIEILKEQGKLKNYALKYNDKLLEIKQKQIQDKVKQQEEYRKTLEKNRKEYQKLVTTTLKEIDNIEGIKITDTEKNKIEKYIFSPVERTENGNYTTKFYKDLQQVFQNPEKMILLAKILKDDMNFNNIFKSLESKVVKETRQKISKTTKHKTDKKSFIDYF